MTEQAQQSPATFGKYQILEELGRGGFGIVYRAFDTVLEVERAIKELYPNLVNDPAFVNRFRQEARIAAKLDHPNLVSVYDFGQIDGKYYLSMGYMPGGSLKDLLKREGKLEPERAYQILAQVCDGLEYAHDRGIIHRDLKPGNILFDETGKARVADMGFAKVMSEGASRSMSASGSLVGTPAYMAPEVWRNKPATPQTDIYSLGCILYEMLTGKVLFEGDSPAEVITKHVVDGPEYAPELPKEMRKVLDKALKREPEQLYPDANSMLADLKAILRAEKNDTVINFFEAKQDPILIPEAVTNNETQPVDEIPQEELLLKGSIDQLEFLPFIQAMELSSVVGFDESNNGNETANEDELVEEVFNESQVVKRNHSRCNQLEKFSFAHQTDVSKRPVGICDKSGQEVVVNQTKRKRIIHTLLVTLLMIGLIVMRWLFIRSIPWGKMTSTEVINSVNANQVQQIGRTPFLNRINYLVSWSPDGKLLTSIGGDNIIIWDAASGERLRTLEAHSSGVESVAWSPDGKRLASGNWNNTIILWDADSGVRLRTLEGHKGYVYSVAWSPDGKQLASGSYDNTIIIWDSQNGEKLHILEGHAAFVYRVVWSPDGKRLASGGYDHAIVLWNADSGERLQTLEGHTEGIGSVAWSPDGKRLASGGWDNTAILWNVDSGERLHTLEGHYSGVQSVAWSPDGEMLASVGWYSIFLWDTDSGERIRTLEGHTDRVNGISWSPDGKRLASSSYDGTIRLWGIP